MINTMIVRMGQMSPSPAAPALASHPPWGACASLQMDTTTPVWTVGPAPRLDILGTGVMMGRVSTGGRCVMEGLSVRMTQMRSIVPSNSVRQSWGFCKCSQEV